MSRMEEIQALRSELLEWKAKLQEHQARYMEGVTNRVEYQKRLAIMTQSIQKRSTDIALAEEVTAVSLASENSAKAKQDDLPEQSNKERPPNPTSATTKSAEEAIALYKSQIETVQGDAEYREKLADVETAMATILREGINEILEVLRDSCKDERLVESMERVAIGESEDAPPSPDKKKKPKVKSIRVLGPEHPLGHDVNSTDGGEVNELGDDDHESARNADSDHNRRDEEEHDGKNDDYDDETHQQDNRNETKKKKGLFGRKKKDDHDEEELEDEADFNEEMQSEEPNSKDKKKKAGWFGRKKKEQDPEEEFDEDIQFDENGDEIDETNKPKKKGWFGKKHKDEEQDHEDFDEEVEPVADAAPPEKKEKKGWFGRKKN